MPMYPPAPLEPRDDASPAVPGSHAADHTAERDAINSIVAELGSNPKGTFSTVDARLADLEANGGGGGSIPPDLLDRLTAVEDAVSAVDVELTNLGDAVSIIDTHLASVADAVSAIDVRLTDVELAVSAIDVALDAETVARLAADTALDGRLDTAETDINTLQVDLADLELRVSAIEPGGGGGVVIGPGGLISPLPVMGPSGPPINLTSEFGSLGLGTPSGLAWGYGDWTAAGYWTRTLAFVTSTNAVFVNLDNVLQRSTFALPGGTLAQSVGRFCLVTYNGTSRIWFLPGVINGGAIANTSQLAYLNGTAWSVPQQAVSSRVQEVTVGASTYWYFTTNVASSGRLYRSIVGDTTSFVNVGSSVNVGGSAHFAQRNLVGGGGRVWMSGVQSASSTTARHYTNTSGVVLASTSDGATNLSPEGSYSSSATSLFYDRAIGVTTDGKRMNLSLTGTGTGRRADLVIMDTTGSSSIYANAYSRPLDAAATNPIHDGLQAPNSWMIVACLAADGNRYIDAVNAAGYVNLAGPFAADVSNLHWAHGEYGSRLRWTVGTTIYEQEVTWA